MWARRIASAATAALVACISVSAPSIAAPEASAGMGHSAIAIWTERDRYGSILYYVRVWQGAGTSAEPAVATIARTRCKGRDYGFICPIGSETPEPIGVTDFMVDPMMEQATLETELHGFSHSVTWTAEESPELFGYGATDGGFLSESIGMATWTRAKGTLFGEDLRTRGWLDFSYMIRGGGAYVSTDEGSSFKVGNTIYKVVPR